MSSAEFLQRFADDYLRACAPEPALTAHDLALSRLGGILAGQDATKAVDVDREFAHLPPEHRAALKASIVNARAERIRTGDATPRDFAVAFLASLERNEPDWTLGEWACAADAPFVLLLLFDKAVKRGAEWATMEWTAARLHVRVELATGHWQAKPPGDLHARPAAEGETFGDLAAWRWTCKRGAALIRLARLIEKGRAL